MCLACLQVVHHIPKGCILDSCGGGLRLGFWFLTKQDICSLMACKAFNISPLNPSLVSFNFNRIFLNRVFISGGLITLDFDGGIIVKSIGVKTIWIGGFIINDLGCNFI